MIHLLDGFNWPVSDSPVNAALTVHKNQPTSFFSVPATQYLHPDSGKGLFGSKEPSQPTAVVHSFKIVARPTLSFSNGKLVVGGSYYASTQNSDGTRTHFGTLLCYTTDAYIGTAFDRSSNGDAALALTRLPSLLIRGNTLMLRKYMSNSASTSTNTYIASRELTGVTPTGKHWYETVYDFNTNTVEVFIDDVSVLLIPYVFSEEEKTAQYRLQVQAQTLSSYIELYVSAIYAADERTGPCKVVAKYANADVSVPPSFGTGPHFQKLNGGFAATDPNKLTTKEDAVAEFALSDSSVVGDVKGVAVFGRLSSTNRSAYETGADVQYGLKLPQGTWTSDKIPVPTPVEATERIEIVVLDKNPITSQPFTKDEVNSLGLSLAFDVTNKFTLPE